MLRVIFDRSAFHGDFFETLANSRLIELCRSRKLSVFHTPIFMDETLAMFGRQTKRVDLRKQMPFILEICNGGFFRPTPDIWHDELVRNYGGNTSVLLPKDRRLQWINEINSGPMISDSWSLWDETEKEREYSISQKFNQRQIFNEVRIEIPLMIKQKKAV